jgi:uroporphyrinogen-III synthase
MCESYNQTLWITRPKKDAQRTALALQKHGIRTFLEPLIEIKEIKFKPENLPENTQAVIFTSNNGVRSFAKQTDRKDLRIITVGDQTAQTARFFGFSKVESAGDNVECLVRYINQFCCPSQGKIIYACAQEVSQDIEKDLTSFALQSIVVYAASTRQQLSKKSINMLKAGQLDGVLFYSAKTALNFSRLLKKNNIVRTTKNLTAYSLSANIDQKIAHIRWKKRYISTLAQESHLVASILREMERRK